MKRRIFSLILAFCMVFALAVRAKAEMRIKILYGKGELVCDLAPMLVNDRTMVPLRAIFEAIGASVDYEDETQKITAVKDDMTVVLHVGSDVMYVNGEEMLLDSPAFVVNGRKLVPLRACAETYKYDEEGRQVLMQTSNGYYVQYTYDAEDRKTSTTTPDGMESYIYDEHGNLIETVYADGSKTTYKYAYYLL